MIMNTEFCIIFIVILTAIWAYHCFKFETNNCIHRGKLFCKHDWEYEYWTNGIIKTCKKCGKIKRM